MVLSAVFSLREIGRKSIRGMADTCVGWIRSFISWWRQSVTLSPSPGIWFVVLGGFRLVFTSFVDCKTFPTVSVFIESKQLDVTAFSLVK